MVIPLETASLNLGVSRLLPVHEICCLDTSVLVSLHYHDTLVQKDDRLSTLAIMWAIPLHCKPVHAAR